MTQSNKTAIVIHHSLTADGAAVSWNAIRKYHTQERGWTNIGYHFGVELVGDVYEVFMGRMTDQEGAHTKEMQMNTVGIGICLVGNFDDAPPPIEQVRKALELVRFLIRRESITADRVLGHREVGLLAGFDWQKGQYKSCPGKQFSMSAFRSLI